MTQRSNSFATVRSTVHRQPQHWRARAGALLPCVFAVAVLGAATIFGAAAQADELCSFTQVSAWGSHTCGVRSDGIVVCWGGTGTAKPAPPPAPSAR